MNKTQTNQFRMFLNTQEALDSNSTLWSSIPIMLSTKNNLDELIQRISDVNEKTVLNSKAVTANKTASLNALIEKAVTLSGILQAYAAVTDNMKLAGKIALTKSDITKIRETDVEAVVTPVIDEARKELSNLADYGLTEELIVEAETSLDDFKTQIGQPRVVRNQAFAAMTLMEELFDAANDLVKNTLDKLMIRFKFTNTEFYSEYERARTIVD
ncbi:hypothetical protein [Draconibacterium halophilum]|uniref:Uncharacterized protein n=1 Tax=Draconibacterium halophilum TaxID=2706887 RepID=A0A6C0RGI5_9BACT|nr:hypothetical protein [Draconibacterium halophilum]QIA08785.1 hypothetical protein G0Q07_14125 [Draconibacterium halophilum]